MSAHLGDRLSAFLDGELAADQRAAVEGHLRECAACARELEELAAVDALARELPVQAPPGYFEALPGRVRSRVRARRRPRPVMVWMATAAAAVLVAVIAPLTLRRAPQPAMAPPPMASPAADVFKERALASAAPEMAQAQRAAPVAPTEPPAAAPAQRRLQEREQDKVQKLDRAAGSATVSRHDAPKAEPPAPAGFAAAPAATRTTVPPATAAPPAAPASPARAKQLESFDSARERRAEEAQTQTKDKDVQAQAANEVRDESRPLLKSADAAAAPAPERKAPVAGALGGHVASALPADQRYEGLRARRPMSVTEARAVRDAWEAFARDQPGDPRADEARVRAIEAGIRAWRLGGGTADLVRARASAAAYLAAEGAPQRPRVRALLDTLPRSPEP
ncbi:MAG: hypothetical protein DMF78_14190 [Acidobacteria bacterium]|nr:MAG: hypothetical protein DMF78_14190 [Acidobacteriota bacterium]